MSAPTPNALRAVIDQAQEFMDHNPQCPTCRGTDRAHVNACNTPNLHTAQVNPMCLLCSYRWVSDAVSTKRTRDDVKTLAGSPGDPTGEFAMSRLEDDKGRRRRIDHQLESVKDAVTSLIAQERKLNRLIESFSGRNGREERYPPGSSMVSKAEMVESWEAKKRREDRGGGYGVG